MLSKEDGPGLERIDKVILVLRRKLISLPSIVRVTQDSYMKIIVHIILMLH